MRSLQQLTVLGILCCCCLTIVAWMPDASSYTRRSNNVNLLLPTTTFLVNTKTTTTTTTVLFAGFGNVEKNDKKEGVKLKPKQQWDRYMTNLKKMERVKVAVRIKGTEDWIVAGYVKSIDNAFTELAVIKQKALIADVSIERDHYVEFFFYQYHLRYVSVYVFAVRRRFLTFF